jgi:hypothetical protein
MAPKRARVVSTQVGGYPDVIPRPNVRGLSHLISRWTILINTNTSYTQDQTHIQRRLIDVLSQATRDLGDQDELERAGILEAYHFRPPLPNGSYSRGTPVEKIEPPPPEMYTGGKTLFAFETAPNTHYLHEHIDLSLKHNWGEGAFALRINRHNFYEYIRRRIIEGTGWDPGRGLFIRIRRIRANMARSYLQKTLNTMTEEREKDFEKNELLQAGVPRTVVDQMA